MNYLFTKSTSIQNYCDEHWKIFLKENSENDFQNHGSVIIALLKKEGNLLSKEKKRG